MFVLIKCSQKTQKYLKLLYFIVEQHFRVVVMISAILQLLQTQYSVFLSFYTTIAFLLMISVGFINIFTVDKEKPKTIF